jgi:hypothetical protein
MLPEVMSTDQWGYLCGSVFALGVGSLYLLAYLQPNRNRLTRAVSWMMSREYVRGWRIDTRQGILIAAVISLGLGVVGIVLFFVGTPPGMRRP